MLMLANKAKVAALAEFLGIIWDIGCATLHQPLPNGSMVTNNRWYQPALVTK